MPSEFESVFATLKQVLAKQAKKFAVKVDTPSEYTLETKSPSPFPQHKGHPLFFGTIKVGKAYVSFHLMALYMSPTKIPPAIKKRMQGKACFNFKKAPEPELLAELAELTAYGVKIYTEKRWL